ncbi:hypothetical protein ACOSQ3_017727 [Xanthoceras sorbifolium]
MEHHREVLVHGRHEMNDKKSTTTATTTKRRAVMTRRLLVDEEMKGDINERADAFIKNFHNHCLIIQWREKRLLICKTITEHHGREVFVHGSDEIDDKKSNNTKREEETMTRRFVVVEEDEKEEDINQLADAFIKNFHSQATDSTGRTASSKRWSS